MNLNYSCKPSDRKKSNPHFVRQRPRLPLQKSRKFPPKINDPKNVSSFLNKNGQISNLSNPALFNQRRPKPNLVGSLLKENRKLKQIVRKQKQNHFKTRKNKFVIKPNRFPFRKKGMNTFAFKQNQEKQLILEAEKLADLDNNCPPTPIWVRSDRENFLIRQENYGPFNKSVGRNEMQILEKTLSGRNKYSDVVDKLCVIKSTGGMEKRCGLIRRNRKVSKKHKRGNFKGWLSVNINQNRSKI